MSIDDASDLELMRQLLPELLEPQRERLRAIYDTLAIPMPPMPLEQLRYDRERIENARRDLYAFVSELRALEPKDPRLAKLLARYAEYAAGRRHA